MIEEQNIYQNKRQLNFKDIQHNCINKKNNILIIVIGILIVLIVAVISFQFGKKQGIISNQQLINKKKPSNSNTTSINPTQTKPKSIISKKNYQNIEKLTYIKDGDIYIYDLKTGLTKRLTYYGYNSSAVVSFDNSKVAFLSIPRAIVEAGKADKGRGSFELPNYYIHTDDGVSSGARNVWIINSDGTDPIQVTDDIKKRSSITWSADSSKIAYEEEGAIIEYSLNNKNKIKITDNGNNPVYSPVNSYLAYLTDNFQTIVVKLPAGEKRFNHGSRIEDLSWSLSEDKIFYTSVDEKIKRTSPFDARFSVWVYFISENKAKQITEDSLNMKSPFVSPDDSFVIVQEGSGYADAGNIDLSSLVLRLDKNFGIIGKIKLEDFAGPDFFEEKKKWLVGGLVFFARYFPVWLNNNEFIIYLQEFSGPKLPDSQEKNPEGIYKLNVDKLTAQRLLELK